MKRLFTALLSVFFAVPAFAQVQSLGYIGEVPAGGATPSCHFATYRYDTGAPATLSGTPAVKVYKDGDSTSEVSTGLTLTADFDSVTGANLVAVDTTNAFYAAGHDYTVYISAGTVNTVSVVGFKVCSFSIANRGDLTIVKGVAFSNYPIWMLTAGGAAVTGLSPSCTISKDGGSFAATANSASQVGSGLYKINLTAAETTASVFSLICTGTGAQTFRQTVATQH